MGFKELRVAYIWGLNICVCQGEKGGDREDTGKDICIGQEDGGGHSPDAGRMTNSVGVKKHVG